MRPGLASPCPAGREPLRVLMKYNEIIGQVRQEKTQFQLLDYRYHVHVIKIMIGGCF